MKDLILRLAIVIIAGLSTLFILTLFVLPFIYWTIIGIDKYSQKS